MEILLANPIIMMILGLGILVYSAILHEIAHGYVADRLGDPTARLMGRLTLDPRPHIDPYMSVFLPLIMLIGSGFRFAIGGAKPVPVDPFNLREGRKDMALVALAGPMSNVLIAIIAASFYKAFLFLPPIGIFEFLGVIFQWIVFYNLLLAIFNLIPIPPLDGSKVFSLLLPEREAMTYMSIGNMGLMLIVFLFLFPIGSFSLGAMLSSFVQFGLNALGIPMPY